MVLRLFWHWLHCWVCVVGSSPQAWPVSPGGIASPHAEEECGLTRREMLLSCASAVERTWAMFTFAWGASSLPRPNGIPGRAAGSQWQPRPKSCGSRALTQEARMPIVQMKSLSPGEAQAAAAAANGDPGSWSCRGEVATSGDNIDSRCEPSGETGEPAIALNLHHLPSHGFLGTLRW